MRSEAGTSQPSHFVVAPYETDDFTNTAELKAFDIGREETPIRRRCERIAGIRRGWTTPPELTKDLRAPFFTGIDRLGVFLPLTLFPTSPHLRHLRPIDARKPDRPCQWSGTVARVTHLKISSISGLSMSENLHEPLQAGLTVRLGIRMDSS